MGILDALPGALFQAFNGKLQTATLYRAVTAASGGLAANGDPLVTVPTTWGCQGFRDAYSDFFTKGGDVPETDAKIMIFAASLPAGVEPQKDDKVQMPAATGDWWQLRGAKTDPATAMWTCQAFMCEAP